MMDAQEDTQKLNRNDKILVILQIFFTLLPCGIMIIPDINYYPDMGNIIFLLLVANVILNIILLLKRDTIFQKVAKGVLFSYVVVLIIIVVMFLQALHKFSTTFPTQIAHMHLGRSICYSEILKYLLCRLAQISSINLLKTNLESISTIL